MSHQSKVGFAVHLGPGPVCGHLGSRGCLEVAWGPILSAQQKVQSLKATPHAVSLGECSRVPVVGSSRSS